METDPKFIANTWAQLDRLLEWLEHQDPQFGLEVHKRLSRPARSTTEPRQAAPSPKAYVRAPRLLQ